MPYDDSTVTFNVYVRNIEGRRPQWFTVADGVSQERALRHASDFMSNGDYGTFDKIEIRVNEEA